MNAHHYDQQFSRNDYDDDGQIGWAELNTKFRQTLDKQAEKWPEQIVCTMKQQQQNSNEAKIQMINGFYLTKL
ncbi:hypothetical protein DERP_012817 [Dermatophagoides pteronyssinus]|uniref:EF-hand domain-containing protein n=1 Tax=Dermatophagoides pteronyssinus TaxID=6956 RepID=A0ABQ8JF67_DERPT|nr:hypothetical protein DERP_012817 [Dermatophagoides pteronyssinus]